MADIYNVVAQGTSYPQSNFVSAVDPTVNDDTSAGYEVGSRWINLTTDTEFVCLDATAGAAVWVATTGAGGLALMLPSLYKGTGTAARYEMPGWYWAANAVAVWSSGRLVYIPIYVHRTTTYDRISIYVDTLDAGKLMRLGIYEATSGVTGLLPGALVLDAGTVSIGTTGIKEINISQELTEGFYYLAFVGDSSVARGYSPDKEKAISPPVGGIANVVNTDMGDTMQQTSDQVAMVAGGLGDPAPAPEYAVDVVGRGIVLLRNSDA